MWFRVKYGTFNITVIYQLLCCAPLQLCPPVSCVFSSSWVTAGHWRVKETTEEPASCPDETPAVERLISLSLRGCVSASHWGSSQSVPCLLKYAPFFVLKLSLLIFVYAWFFIFIYFNLTPAENVFISTLLGFLESFFCVFLETSLRGILVISACGGNCELACLQQLVHKKQVGLTSRAALGRMISLELNALCFQGKQM